LLSSGAPEPPVAFEVLEVVVRELVVRVAADGGAGAAGAGAGTGAARGAGAGAGAGAVVAAAAAAIPPCPEQAPRPPLDWLPSVQATIALALAFSAFAAAVAFASTPP
jgi:hypothetical protein